MQVQRFKLTIPEASGIRCPFTGNVLDVYVSVCEGVATYNAPDAFTLAEPVESIDVLYHRASMRDGIAGVAGETDRMTDPYTGARMSLRETPDGRFLLEGGFNPRVPSISLADFLAKASCGRVRMDDPPEAKSVPDVSDETEPEEDAPHEAVGDITEETGERMAKVIGADRGRTSVSMARKGRPGKAK